MYGRDRKRCLLYTSKQYNFFCEAVTFLLYLRIQYVFLYFSWRLYNEKVYLYCAYRRPRTISVSYTHLDVYTRQGISVWSTVEGEQRLDVYKRQV